MGLRRVLALAHRVTTANRKTKGRLHTDMAARIRVALMLVMVTALLYMTGQVEACGRTGKYCMGFNTHPENRSKASCCKGNYCFGTKCVSKASVDTDPSWDAEKVLGGAL